MLPLGFATTIPFRHIRASDCLGSIADLNISRRRLALVHKLPLQCLPPHTRDLQPPFAGRWCLHLNKVSAIFDSDAEGSIADILLSYCPHTSVGLLTGSDAHAATCVVDIPQDDHTALSFPEGWQHVQLF